MTLTCNQCGAPLVITDPNLPFVSCNYCQTATAVPARPAPPPEPTPRPEPRPQAEPQYNATYRSKRGPNPFAYALGRAARALAMPGIMLVAMLGFAASRGAFQPFLAALNGPPTVPPARAAELVSEVRTVEPPPVTLPAEVIGPKKPVPAPKKAGARSAKGSAPTPSASATGALVPPPPPPLKLKVSVGSVRIEGKGSYPKDQARAGISGVQGAFRSCYAAALAEDRSVAGQLDMGFQIGSDGAVRGAGVSNPTTPSGLNACVNRALTAQRFPKPEDGGLAQVRFVLRLSTEP